MSYRWLKYANSLKIVAIHGKGNTGSSFENKIKPFVDSTKGVSEWIFPTAPYEADGGYAWWTLGKGVRSFEAKEFGGVDASIRMIEELYPFDAMVGHSQGAMLAAIILSRGLLNLSDVRPKYAILSGSAWPAPFGPLLESIPSTGELLNDLHSLHIIGDKDDINPPAMAKKVCDLFHGEMYRHPGGHILPVDENSLQSYHSFLKL